MRPGDILLLMRPRQWSKNLAVFAGIIFSANLLHPGTLAKTVLAFLALNLASSAVYAFNDAADAELDRQHPVKRLRPVASGAVSRRQALAISGVLLVGALSLSAALGAAFAAVVVGFLVLHLLYGIALKHVAIIDMLAIALGFVLRAVAGTVVIGVRLSPWLVLCTGLLALFLASAKRRHELSVLREYSSDHRPVLAEYSTQLLDSFMVTLSAATVTSYALYTFFEQRATGHTMMLTIPFVIYGVFRYQSLVLDDSVGGQPEEVLLADGPILADVALWTMSVVFLLYALPRLVG